MATEPPTPPQPGSPDPDGSDAPRPTPPVSFTKPSSDPSDRPAPSDVAPTDAIPADAPPAAPSLTGRPEPSVPAAPADAVPPAPPVPPAPAGTPAARDVWAPPEPGSVPAAPGAYPPPPGSGFGPPVPPGPQGAGPYPYGMPPAPFGQFAPEKPSFNGLAVTALVLGLLCCVPLVGAILGVIALLQIKKNGQRGKGLAVAGIALSTVGALLTVLFFTAGPWDEFKEGFKEGARDANATASLQPSDCFDEPGAPDAVTGEETYVVEEIVEVPCDVPHQAEVYARLDLPGGSYPGETGVIDQADRRCVEHLYRFPMDAWELAQEATYSYYYPTKVNWSFGDRTVICFLASEAGELTGSLRKDVTVLDADQLAYLKPVAGLDGALAGAPFAGVDEDLAAHQEWAGEVAGELSTVSEALRSYDWEPEAAPLAARLADELDEAGALWEKLPDTKDGDEFRTGWGEALFALTDGTGGAEDLREALDLSTDRPDSGSNPVAPGGAL
ncbi:DUF4190 domain-containing protein [Streptomyces sp. NPDC002734]|uniref:DUF4190 domain-containing protein n=1 Tax=Streptomyces sp. NPDC002734 TaxID=3154426 RepID=UPI0033314FC6